MSYAANISPLISYNSLADEHLAHYYANPRIRRHLLRAGLITRDGCIVDEITYREKIARKEHQDHVKNLLAQSIIDKALEMERKRQDEIKKRLEEFYKLESVRRVKDGKLRHGDEDFMALLTPRMVPTPPATPLRREKGQSQRNCAKLSDSSPDLHDGLMGSPYTLSPSPSGRFQGFMTPSIDIKELRRVHSSPPFRRKKKRPKTAPVLSKTEPLLFKRTQTQSMAKVTLRYLGSSLHLEGWLDTKASDVTVIQQHGGGSSLCVFKGPVIPKSKFVFTSKRSRGAPFGITIYVDGMLKARLSTCCEYKYKPGHLLGGKQSHFQLIHVSDAAPCYRCQAEAESSRWKIKQMKKSESAEPPPTRRTAETESHVADDEDEEEEEEEENEIDVDEVLRRFRATMTEDNELNGIDEEVTGAVSMPLSGGVIPLPSFQTIKGHSRPQGPVPVIAVQTATPQFSEFEESEAEENQTPSPSEQEEEKNTETKDKGSGYSSDDEDDQERPVSRKQRKVSAGKRLSASANSSHSAGESSGGESDEEGEPEVVQLKDDEEAYGESDFEEEEERTEEEETSKEGKVDKEEEGDREEEKDEDEEKDEEEEKEKDDEIEEEKKQSSDKDTVLKEVAEEEKMKDTEQQQRTSESDANSVAEMPEDNTQRDEEAASDHTGTTVTVQDTEQQEEVITMTDDEKQQDDKSQITPPEEEDIHDEVAELDMPTNETSEKTEGIPFNENGEQCEEIEIGKQPLEEVELSNEVDQAGKEEDKVVGKQTEAQQQASEEQNEVKEDEIIDKEEAESQANTAQLPEQQKMPAEAKPETANTQDTPVQVDEEPPNVAQEDETTMAATGAENGTHPDEVKESSATVVASEVEMKHVKDLMDDQPQEDQVQQATTDVDSAAVTVTEPPADERQEETTEQDERQEETTEQVSNSLAESSQMVESGLHVHAQRNKDRLVKSESDTSRVNLSHRSDLTRSGMIEKGTVNETETESADTKAVEKPAPKPEQPQFTRPPLNIMMSAKMLLKESPSGMSLHLSDDETTEQHEDIILSESETDELLDDLIPALSPGSDSKATSPVPESGHGPAESSGAEISGSGKEEPIGHTPTTSRTVLAEPIAPILEGKTAADFSNIALTHEQVSELAAVIDKPETVINTVNLRNSAVGDTAVSSLTNAISSNKTKVQMLNLNLNNLTPEGARQIADNVLRNNTSLQYLLLHGNPIGDDGFRWVVDALVESGEQEDANRESTNKDQQKKRGRHRQRRLSSSTTSSLSSSSSDSSDDETRMQRPEPETHPTSSPSQEAQNTSVICLDVGDCKLTDESAPHVARLLRSNQTLTELNLSANHFTASGWREIAQALKESSSLSNLRLDYCSMEDDGLVELCDALAHNSSLKSLDLEGNKITGKGASVLLEALKVNTSLLEVTLMPGNTIEESIQDSIRKLLKDRKSTNDR